MKFVTDLTVCEMASKIELAFVTQKVSEFYRGIDKI